MKKLSIDLPDDVYQAVTEEGEREFRNPSQQASYLLLTWARDTKEKRQRADKVASTTVNGRRESDLSASTA